MSRRTALGKLRLLWLVGVICLLGIGASFLYGPWQDYESRRASREQFRPIIGEWTSQEGLGAVSFNVDGTCTIQGRQMRYSSGQRSEAMGLGGTATGWDPGVVEIEGDQIGLSGFYEFRVSPDGQVLTLAKLGSDGDSHGSITLLRGRHVGEGEVGPQDEVAEHSDVTGQSQDAPVGDGDLYAAEDAKVASANTGNSVEVPIKQTGLVGWWGQGPVKIWFREDGTFKWEGPYGFTEGTWRSPRQGEVEMTFPRRFGDMLPAGSQVVYSFQLADGTLKFLNRTIYAPGEAPARDDDLFELERMKDWYGNPL